MIIRVTEVIWACLTTSGPTSLPPPSPTRTIIREFCQTCSSLLGPFSSLRQFLLRIPNLFPLPPPPSSRARIGQATQSTPFVRIAPSFRVECAGSKTRRCRFKKYLAIRPIFATNNRLEKKFCSPRARVHSRFCTVYYLYCVYNSLEQFASRLQYLVLGCFTVFELLLCMKNFV